MKSTYKKAKAKPAHNKGGVIYAPQFPRPICLEHCTMNIKKGYEENILMTLKAFSNENAYKAKTPHKLSDTNTWSLDVKSRHDLYRLLFKVEGNICKISNLCTEETH